MLTGLMMFLQPLTWQTIANRNEPPATEARSAPVQWALVYQTTRDLIVVRRTTMPNVKQHTDQCSLCAITEHISSLHWHSSNCFSLFSLACMNKMKQSKGININAVITALRATQNQDNSRRLASRKKKKILITLASAFFLNGRHAAACHFCLESVQTYPCCCRSLLHAPPEQAAN